MPAAAMLVVAAMAPVEGTRGVGYLPAEATSPEATNGTTRRPAAPRRTTSTGNPAAAERAAPAAARSPPAARRTPTPPTAAGAGRDPLPRTHSPSPPPPARTSTAATRARAARGSAAPRRRPDLPPAAPRRQLSGPWRRSGPHRPRRLAAAAGAPQDPGLLASAARARSRRAGPMPPMGAPPNQATSSRKAPRRAEAGKIRAPAAAAPSRPMQCKCGTSASAHHAELVSGLPLPALPWCPRLDGRARV
uniref:Uncharacterized protein n=1 Tax=Arundo donax TaxID=35708 RepID=A0A0A9FJL1_ARUDO